jgi:site-specific DNA recombinase
MVKVAIYSRVSSQEQATEGVSIEAQAAALKAYAKSQKWEIFNEYIDAGYSGGTDERPALKRLMIDAGQYRFDIIAVCKLDRYFRNLRLLLNNLHNMEKLGIRFVSIQEGIDTSNHYGSFITQFMGVIAEFERGRIGERVKDSRQFLIGQGIWPGGRTLYGYRWLVDKKQWEIVPEEARVVRYIFDLYLNEKMGIDAIVTRLNKEESCTRTGSRWRRANVRQVLVHPAYNGRHKLEVRIPTIIDDATWYRAQEKRENARKLIGDPRGWLLQGMCVCGLCGHVMSCVHKKPGQPRYYACRSRIQSITHRDGKRCDLPFVRAKELEWGVWKKVKEVINNRDTLAECINKALLELEEQKLQIGAESLEIDDKLESIKSKKERLGMAFADGAVSESSYKSRLNQLKKLETTLFKSHNAIHPSQLGELSALEERINRVKDILGRGNIYISEFGIFGAKSDEYFPAGFNAWRESDGKLAIGEFRESDRIPIEGTDQEMRGIDAPPGFWECKDPQGREDHIKRNLRSILQLFQVKAFIFPDRIEIKGAIPTQLIEFPEKHRKSTAPIISSPSQTQLIKLPVS